MKRPHWWEGGELSVEAEAAWFAEDGLDFELDRELFESSGVVVFRGELRFGERSTPAEVVYPPAYGAGAHPYLVAPELRLGRHQSPDGGLCLDHPVFGELAPMYGGEAVLRAERLWRLWEEDREALEAAEADAPDPRANYYPYSQESAVVLLDVDVAGGERGHFDLAATDVAPLRGGVTGVRVTHPRAWPVPVADGISSFAGQRMIHGAWIRIPEPPPVRLEDLSAWLRERHRAFVDRQLRFARGQGAETPALVAFVYPDEGPGRHEYHDARLVLAISQQGQLSCARTFHLRDRERWLRQPQLEPLAKKRVAIVGVGALGSQIEGLIARAGVGQHFLLDHDIVTIGNRIRHELDPTDLGRYKVRAVAARALRINPWAEVQIQGARLGASITGPQARHMQELDDRLADELGGADLIVNATADAITGRHVSAIAAAAKTPVLHVWVSAGAWGGRVLVQRPGESGCTHCLALAQRSPDKGAIPDMEADQEANEVADLGCADPTFTGPGFELATVAAHATRIAVQVLLAGDGHPELDYDLATLTLRTAEVARPEIDYRRLPVQRGCRVCS